MSTDQPNQPDEAADQAKNEDIFEMVGKVMETEPPNIGWMTGELAHRLLHAFAGGRTLMQMSLLRSGMSKDQAEEQAGVQFPLLAFDLGLRVGREMEAVRQLREMFGPDA